MLNSFLVIVLLVLMNLEKSKKANKNIRMINKSC